jgi:hypothetical protein
MVLGLFYLRLESLFDMWVALNWNHGCVNVLQLDFWGRSDADYLVEIWGLRGWAPAIGGEMSFFFLFSRFKYFKISMILLKINDNAEMLI